MTIKRIIVCSLGILSFALNTMAARIDTLSVESPKMKKEIKVAVIVPDQALEGKNALPYICCTDMEATHLPGWELSQNFLKWQIGMELS